MRAARVGTVGQSVELHGLVNKPELNGRRGVVVAFISKTGRSAVKLDDGSGPFDIKQENLTEFVPPFEQPVEPEEC
jgi:hypothetical protein